MAITASRLGSSPLMLDWSNIMRPGRSVSGTPEAKASFDKTWGLLRARFDSGEIGFYESVVQPGVSQIAETLALAHKIRSNSTFTDCLFLGIGGSSLGPISLLEALKQKADGKLRLHFVENPDPIDWKMTLKGLRPESTLVVPVTKSGTTFETLAQFLLALEWLGHEKWKTHVVAITDPKNGDLRAFATEHAIPTLTIAPSMGGRFSIFTPVGLFPAVLAGLDAEAFLAGAAQIRDYVDKTPHEKNSLFQIGTDLIAHFGQRPIHVCMPYASRLKSFGSWFVQLWGESLGKDGKGFTPLAALGAVDQHSILQLLRDGPDDKVIFFLTIENFSNLGEIPAKIPHLSRLHGNHAKPSSPAFAILEGHSLQELLQVEYKAINLVLTKNGRPNFTLNLERLDERNLGALYFAMSVLTAFTGTAWGINPFDQPGVEEGKIYIRDSLTNPASREPEVDDNSPVARLRTYANRGAESSDN